MNRSREPVLFFSKKEKAHIVAAIQEAEKKTSGEIRVHLEKKTLPDILAQAKTVFERLGMSGTKHRNGVLILMGTQSKKFAVVADIGIYQHFSPDFLGGIVSKMEGHFKQGHFSTGIVEAIRELGEKLQTHFPHHREDLNELPDEISYSV